MNGISPHTLKVLEFEKIISTLKELCMSNEGAKKISSQGFFLNEKDLRSALNNAVSMRRVFETGERFPSLSFPNIESVLLRIKKGSIRVEPVEVVNVAVYVESALRLKRFLKKNLDDANLIDIVNSIPDLHTVPQKIFSVLNRDGEFKEKEIPELRTVSRRLKNLQSEVEKLAFSYLRNPDYRQYWQTDMPTYKDNRLVLPLKVNFKGRIRGIAHEVSSSGSTVFFEPFDVVEKNNLIVEARSDYEKIIRELIKQLVSTIISYMDDIFQLLDMIGFLDMLIAKARYAVQNNCNCAHFERGVIKLLDARHPFLGKHAVPITIEGGKDYRILIITGPNTGGKTVTLKTIGLLALMNQFGMEIPAEDGSVLGVFDNVFCDIGDEQSIEQSLSTFSAHIRNIVSILEGVNDNSLVLLDELGAGTDPEEGVAIAMALLDYFYEKRCLLFATTHHGILKNYGYSKSGVENASMEFNEETFSPTFRVEIGIPGESHALEIARRSGMPDSIVKRAERYIKEERTDISGLIKNLSDRQRKVFAMEREQQKKEAMLREAQRRTDLKNLHLKQKEIELREDGLRMLKKYLAETRSEIEQVIKEIREKTEGVPKKDNGDIGRGIKRLREIMGKIEGRVKEEEKRLEKQIEELISGRKIPIEVGMEVMVKGSGKHGRVIRKERGNRWLVETDNVRVSIGEYDLEPIGETRGKGVKQLGKNDRLSWNFYGNPRALLELDVRGKRLDDAIAEVEKQIDSALLSGLTEFSIIHGMGEGILQRGIREYLKSNKAVSSFHFAQPEDGGFGKTVVRLKN